jgi:hypothetical protein
MIPPSAHPRAVARRLKMQMAACVWWSLPLFTHQGTDEGIHAPSGERDTWDSAAPRPGKKRGSIV